MQPQTSGHMLECQIVNSATQGVPHMQTAAAEKSHVHDSAAL